MRPDTLITPPALTNAFKVSLPEPSHCSVPTRSFAAESNPSITSAYWPFMVELENDDVVCRSSVPSWMVLGSLTRKKPREGLTIQITRLPFEVVLRLTKARLATWV